MKEPKSLTFEEFADELLAEKQPRALIILASSQLDFQLKGVLEKYLLPKSSKSKEADELLEGDRPLSTFSARIKMCRRLGLIDADFYQLIDKLREVRNSAAHWRIFGVGEAPLKELLKNLRGKVENRTSFQLILAKYFGNQPKESITGIDGLQAVLLTICALAASLEDAAEQFAIAKRQQVTLD